LVVELEPTRSSHSTLSLSLSLTHTQPTLGSSLAQLPQVRCQRIRPVRRRVSNHHPAVPQQRATRLHQRPLPVAGHAGWRSPSHLLRAEPAASAGAHAAAAGCVTRTQVSVNRTQVSVNRTQVCVNPTQECRRRCRRGPCRTGSRRRCRTSCTPSTRGSRPCRRSIRRAPCRRSSTRGCRSTTAGYGDEKVANRDVRVRHGATENGP
jgi:hypothetical protein